MTRHKLVPDVIQPQKAIESSLADSGEIPLPKEEYAETARHRLILDMIQFQKAIESFLANPGEIPLLKIRKNFLKERRCPLIVGIGSRAHDYHILSTSSPLPSDNFLSSNPAVAALQNKMRQEPKGGTYFLKGGIYFWRFCNVCPLVGQDKRRCNLDEFYSKARARMSFQQKKKKYLDTTLPEYKMVLDEYRVACSKLMSSCIIGLIELSAILSSIIDGEGNKHD